MFVSAVDPATLFQICNFGIDPELTSVDTILDRIQALVLKKTNAIAERMRLHKRRQKTNKSMEWAADLHHLLKTCQYPGPGTLLPDFSLQDFTMKQIIIGNCVKIQEKLLDLPINMSLDNILTLAIKAEETSHQGFYPQAEGLLDGLIRLV